MKHELSCLSFVPSEPISISVFSLYVYLFLCSFASWLFLLPHRRAVTIPQEILLGMSRLKLFVSE